MDRLLILEILASAGIVFFMVWIIKFSIIFSDVRSLGAESFFKSTLRSLVRGLIEFLETITRREKFIGVNFRWLERVSVCLAFGAGLTSILALELSEVFVQTLNLGILSFSYICLCSVELQVRGWKNTDLTFLFFLKSFLILFSVVLISIVFPANNDVIFGLDFLFALIACILFFREVHYFCETDKEASLVEVNFVAALIVITSSFLVRKTIFDIENYFWELTLILSFSVLFFGFAIASGQLARLISLEKKADTWLGFVSAYLVIRLVAWTI